MKGASGGLNGLFINYADYFHAGLYECIAQTTITQTSVATNVIVRGNYQSHPKACNHWYAETPKLVLHYKHWLILGTVYKF